MKGIKKLSLLALGLLFVAGVASCSTKNNTDDNKQSDNGNGDTPTPDPTPVTPPDPTPTDVIPQYEEMEALDSEIGELSSLEQPSNMPGIYVNEENKLQYRLQTIKAYTDSDKEGLARTVFYLGEEFNYDNLLVLADFIKVDENGNAAKDENGKTITLKARVTNFQVDSSAIDTSVTGAYDAKVTYRFGEIVRTYSYTIMVRTSEFETTKSLVYIAGIKAGYKSDYGVDSNGLYKLENNGRILTTYLRYNTTDKVNFNDFSLNSSDLNVQIVKNKVNSRASEFSTEYIDFDTSTLIDDETNKKLHNEDDTFVIDYSAVNVGAVGSYLISITYNAGNIQVNGREVENIVKAFIVVDVISPITQVINTNTEYSIEASMGLPDFSTYKVSFRRKIWTGTAFGNYLERNVLMTNDLFKYENLISYSQGTQPTTFTLKEQLEDENGNLSTYSFTSDVTVTESTMYNISVVRDITNGTVIKQTTDESSQKITYNEYDLGSGVKAYNVGVGKPNKNNIPEYLDKGKTCLSDGLNFTGFLGLDSLAKKSYVEFTFTKKTTLILYIGSNGDDDRSFAVYDVNNESEVIYEGTAEVAVAGAKQTPVRFVLELEPGVYRVSAIGSTLTFHGYVIGTLKD